MVSDSSGYFLKTLEFHLVEVALESPNRVIACTDVHKRVITGVGNEHEDETESTKPTKSLSSKMSVSIFASQSHGHHARNDTVSYKTVQNAEPLAEQFYGTQ